MSTLKASNSRFRSPDWFPQISARYRSSCRICGTPDSPAPWGEDGWTVPTFGICSTCECTFGVEDTDPSNISAYRRRLLCSERKGKIDVTKNFWRIPPPFRHAPEIHSVSDWKQLRTHLFFEELCRAVFFIEKEQIIRLGEFDALLTAWNPHLSLSDLELIVASGCERALAVLRKRPELSFDERWQAIFGIE